MTITDEIDHSWKKPVIDPGMGKIHKDFYIVVVNHSLQALSIEVNNLMKEGFYTVAGGIGFNGASYLQALVLK
jgi:hypothetical protein